MSRKRKASKFAGKVRGNAQKTKGGGAEYGYLRLPKGVSVYQPEPGSRCKFDIIPYTVTEERHPDRDDDIGIAVPGDIWYKRPFKIHRNIGSENDSVVCPAHIGKKCPICEYRAVRVKDGADKEETDALKQSLRNLYVVVPIGDKKREAEPHIWDISQYLFQNLLAEELEEDDDYEVFPDLEDGLTLRVRFDSKVIGKGKPFAEASRIDFEERKEQYGEDYLNEVPDLDDVLIILPYAQLESKFFEIDTDKEEASEDEEKPERRKPAARRARRKAEEEEEEDSPESEDEDEERCVACSGSGVSSKGGKCHPCRGTGVKLKKRAEEDPPAAEEEEDPPPQRTKRKQKSAETRRDKNKKSEDECPHGHTFGADCEDFKECDDCDLWDRCIEVKEAEAS